MSKIIYMECTLALMVNIDPIVVDKLSHQGELKQTEQTRYLVIQDIDGENR